MHAPLTRAAVTTAALTVALLTVPLVTMQFTREVNWGVFDLVAAGGLLFGAGMSYCLLARRIRNAAPRFAVAVLVSAALSIVWAELAVGLFT